MRPRRPFAPLVLALSLIAALLFLCARPAEAHLMPARQGTVHVVGDSAFIVVSVPVSALHGFDDDGDGLLSMAELSRHEAELRADIDRRLVVSDGAAPGTTMLVNVVLAPDHESRADRADHLVALKHARFDAPPKDLHLTFDLFGTGDAEGQVTITGSRDRGHGKGDKETEAAILTRLSPEHRFFRPLLAALLDYVRAGAEHVLFGADQLLFLLTVIVAGLGWRYRLGVVTSFTVAHSVTLGLALFGVLRVPSHVVEPLIALSIVLMAVDNLLRKTVAMRQRVALVCACGLLHGLGFASSMDAMGLDGAHRVASLAGFNVGVELGQASFLAATLALLFVLRRLAPRLTPGHVMRAVSVLAAVMGAVWMVQRI